MADPRPSRRAHVVAAALCATMLATVGSAATGGPTFSNCGKFKLDGKSASAKFPRGSAGTTQLNDVTITADGCDMEIKANSISTTSLDMANSDWTLAGNVRIRSDEQQSRLSSDQAVVQFRNSEIQRITMTGNPAEFEQRRPDSGLVTRGHAKRMVYEASAGTVRLVEDAWISDGGREIRTPQIEYDIRRAEIRSSGGQDSGKSTAGSGGDRVIITIDPKASKDPKNNDDAKPGEGPSPAKPE